MSSMSLGTRPLLRVVVAALTVGVVMAWAPPARAGVDCTFVADPPDSQFRGWNITVTGSFNSLPNREFVVFLGSESGGVFGAYEGYLEPAGMTNGSGFFDHTVTIPADHATGDFDLTVFASAGGGDLRSCSIPYTVTQLFLVPGIIITTTTLGLAPPPTTEATTTTSVATTTTTTEPAEATTSTAVEEPTTTVEATTTTVAAGDDDAIVAGEQVDGGAAPGWMIALLIAMALALVGIGAHALGKKGTRAG
jgi:hypothetical protein